jgi:hypothetical protein
MALRLHPSAIGMINFQGYRSFPPLAVDLAHGNLARGAAVSAEGSIVCLLIPRLHSYS